MRRLVRQIEQLLYSEECVVVPGVGAFLVHHEPAVADRAKGLIFPGHCRISFNTTLCDNDGVLVRSYSEAFSFGYKRSLALLEKDIDELKAQLLSAGVVQIGEVGKLAQPKGMGQVQFIPNPQHPFSVDYYGLRPVAMLPPIRKGSEQKSIKGGKKGHIYYLPINLRVVGYSSVAAAMTAIALLIPNKKLHIPADLAQHQAGFLTTQVQEKSSEPEAIEVVEQEEAPQLAGFRITTEEEGRGQYYVVVATLPNEATAKKFVAESKPFHRFRAEGGVLVSSRGLYRFYAECFVSSEEAQEYLRHLTKEPLFANAWIYKQ